MTDETTLDLGELSKHKPTIAEFNEGANDQANYGQEGLYVMPDSIVAEYGKLSDHKYLKAISPSSVIQQPSGAIIKLKNREHALEFIKEKQVDSISSCIFYLNGDISIDIQVGKKSYKGFFNNSK